MSASSKSQSSTAAAGRRSGKDHMASDSPAQRATGKPSTPSVNSPAHAKSPRTPGAGTPISARAAVKKFGNGSSNATNVSNGQPGDGTVEEDGRAQSAATIEDLQERLRKAEEAAEDSRKHIALLDSRLQTTTLDQGKLEETIQENNERIEQLEKDKKEGLRLRRELELLHESDRAASLTFKEHSQAKQDELQDTIQRLKDTLAQRPLSEENRRPGISRDSSFRSVTSPQVEGGGYFAPSSGLHRSDSRNSSRLVLQKDKIIESLRMELAEAHIKLVEMDNMGDPQTRELDRKLLEVRMANARLMEENESFQLLLSERTLNGDLSHSALLQTNSPNDPVKASSLADELENAEEDNQDDDAATKQYKTRIASLTDENKALTLYINSIISRLLQHENVEYILEQNPDPSAATKMPLSPEKDLPPAPLEKDEALEGGFLQRTMSALGGRKPRPQSMFMPETFSLPTAHENPETAPRIPLGRGGQRSGSGQRRNTQDWTSAGLVNNMYRGPSPTRSAQLSPGLTSPRNSFLGTRPSGSSRVTSGSTVPTISESEKFEYTHRQQRDSKISSGRNSIAGETSPSTSPPPSTIGGTSDKGNNSSVMIGSKMRPLRLVQNNAEEEAAKKASNRQSWMGWFNKGT